MLTKERMSQIKKLVFAWEEDERLKEEYSTLDHESSGITGLLFALTNPFEATPTEDRLLTDECEKRLQRASADIGIDIDELKEWHTQLAIQCGWYPRPGESLEQLEVRRGGH